jgi:rod shape-determining protein MreC
VVLAAVLIIVLNLPPSVSGRAKSMLREGLAPLQQLLSGMSLRVKEAAAGLRGLGGLARENQEMEGELARLRNDVRDLQALEQENMELREHLQFKQRAERVLIPCEVIARDISGWWQTIRLGRGSAEGITENKAVMTPDGVVGKTIDVSSRTCDVLLISDPACKVSARLSRTGAFGIVTGGGLQWNGRAICHMEFLNKNLPVQPGDEVVTSGLGGVFPKGLLIGYVEKVHSDHSGLYQRAEVLPKASLGALSYVFIVVEEEDPIDEMLRTRTLKAEEGP